MLAVIAPGFPRQMASYVRPRGSYILEVCRLFLYMAYTHSYIKLTTCSSLPEEHIKLIYIINNQYSALWIHIMYTDVYTLFGYVKDI